MDHYEDIARIERELLAARVDAKERWLRGIGSQDQFLDAIETHLFFCCLIARW